MEYLHKIHSKNKTSKSFWWKFVLEIHLPGDSSRDPTLSPNVGLVTIHLWKGHLMNSPSQKGHNPRIARPLKVKEEVHPWKLMLRKLLFIGILGNFFRGEMFKKVGGVKNYIQLTQPFQTMK